MTLPLRIKLGRYEIRSQPGEGGMGGVYLAALDEGGAAPRVAVSHQRHDRPDAMTLRPESRTEVLP